MTTEQKQLLIKDLCARIPYGVILNVEGVFGKPKHEQLAYVDSLGRIYISGYNLPIYLGDICLGETQVKPFLRPMSSMTKEEINEFHKLRFTHVNYGSEPLQCVLSIDETDWLNTYHFDYRGFIEKGLALPAPDGMYNF